MGSLSDTPLAVIFLVVRRVRSFSYDSRAGNYLVVRPGVGWWMGGASLTRIVLESVSLHTRRKTSLSSPILESISSVGGRIVSVKRPVLNSV